MTSELHKVNFASPLLSAGVLENILNRSKVKSLPLAPRQFYVTTELLSRETRSPLFGRLSSPRSGHKFKNTTNFTFFTPGKAFRDLFWCDFLPHSYTDVFIKKKPVITPPFSKPNVVRTNVIVRTLVSPCEADGKRNEKYVSFNLTTQRTFWKHWFNGNEGDTKPT